MTMTGLFRAALNFAIILRGVDGQQYEPTHVPSYKPSSDPTPKGPTYYPTLMPTECDMSPSLGVCEFKCGSNAGPISVHIVPDGVSTTYSVTEIDPLTGVYAPLYQLPWWGGAMNGASVMEQDASYYAVAAFDAELCFFDSQRRSCFDSRLEYDFPNAAVVLGTTYYYGRSPGKSESHPSILYVEGIDSDDPNFVTDALFTISKDLYNEGVLDFVVVVDSDEEFVEDGGAYLFGLSCDHKLLIVKLQAKTNGGFPPTHYAVLDTVVDYGESTSDVLDSGDCFGAAYSFEGGKELLFAANNDRGLFKLGGFPLAVPAQCWNTGFNDEEHVFCDSVTASLTWWAPSEDTGDFSDGFNCPNPRDVFDVIVDPTAAPTKEPCLSPSALWADNTVCGFDCDSYKRPLQVIREDGDVRWNVMELDTTTGQYDLVYELPYVDSDGIIFAVAMYTDGLGYYTPFGTFGDQLCRFDALHRVCLDGILMEPRANVATLVGSTFYYSRAPGDGGDERVYFVTDIDGDEPVFHEETAFSFSESIIVDEVSDMASYSDGDSTYLVGLDYAHQAVIVRVDSAGMPEAYAVIPTVFDWNGHTPENGVPSKLIWSSAYNYPYESQELMFSSISGEGLFELVLPLIVPVECWNTGFDHENHVACDTVSSIELELRWRLSAEALETEFYTDGMNCPVEFPVAGRPSPKPTVSFDPTLSPAPTLTKAPSSFAPTPFPTPFDPYKPTLTPTQAPTCGAYCWLDLSIEPFNCTNRGPLQISKEGEAFSMVELDVTTGVYSKVYDISGASFDGVAVYDASSTESFALGAFGTELCRFDGGDRVCFTTGLLMEHPTAGAIIGTTYYYARDLGLNPFGSFIYRVKGINGDNADFGNESQLMVSSQLYLSAVDDLTALIEVGDQDLIADNEVGSYLVGLAHDGDLLIVRLDQEGLPVAYAVLYTTIDWPTEEQEKTMEEVAPFGAAFTYDGGRSVYFSSDKGEGLFKLSLPIKVPTKCWNFGTDVNQHGHCEKNNEVLVEAHLVWTAEASMIEGITTTADGLSCSLQTLPLTCTDASDWRVEGSSFTNGCEWVLRDLGDRCPMLGEDGSTATESCQAACDCRCPAASEETGYYCTGPTQNPTVFSPPQPTSTGLLFPTSSFSNNTPEPTAVCEDSATWHKRDDEPEKNCAWVADLADFRCNLKGEDGSRASDVQNCRSSCDCRCASAVERGGCDGIALLPTPAPTYLLEPTSAAPTEERQVTCRDLEDWRELDEPTHDCDWVAEFAEDRCFVPGFDGENALSAAEACETKCECICEPAASSDFCIEPPTPKPTLSQEPTFPAPTLDHLEQPTLNPTSFSDDPAVVSPSTSEPSVSPSPAPTLTPTTPDPTVGPSFVPTREPPDNEPSSQPTTKEPTTVSTAEPSFAPTRIPTATPQALFPVETTLAFDFTFDVLEDDDLRDSTAQVIAGGFRKAMPSVLSVESVQLRSFVTSRRRLLQTTETTVEAVILATVQKDEGTSLDVVDDEVYKELQSVIEDSDNMRLWIAEEGLSSLESRLQLLGYGTLHDALQTDIYYFMYGGAVRPTMQPTPIPLGGGGSKKKKSKDDEVGVWFPLLIFGIAAFVCLCCTAGVVYVTVKPRNSASARAKERERRWRELDSGMVIDSTGDSADYDDDVSSIDHDGLELGGLTKSASSDEEEEQQQTSAYVDDDEYDRRFGPSDDEDDVDRPAAAREEVRSPHPFDDDDDEEEHLHQSHYQTAPQDIYGQTTSLLMEDTPHEDNGILSAVQMGSPVMMPPHAPPTSAPSPYQPDFFDDDAFTHQQQQQQQHQQLSDNEAAFCDNNNNNNDLLDDEPEAYADEILPPPPMQNNAAYYETPQGDEDEWL